MSNILEFWFPNTKFNKFWFDKSKDKEIVQQFSSDLIIIEEKTLLLTDIGGLENEKLPIEL